MFVACYIKLQKSLLCSMDYFGLMWAEVGLNGLRWSEVGF
jgi:hypothetical protein